MISDRRDAPPGALGTYRGGCNPARVLEDGLIGRVVVHIDLDYLINDFNGNDRDLGWAPAAGARAEAGRKLDAFFAALRASRLAVDRRPLPRNPLFQSAGPKYEQFFSRGRFREA